MDVRAIRKTSQSLDPGPDANAPAEAIDQRFIPVRAADLIDALERDAHRFGTEPNTIRVVAVAFRNAIIQEAAGFQERLADAYAPFDPDRETLSVGGDESTGSAPHAPDGADPESGYSRLLRSLDAVLDKANYVRLDEIDIQKLLESASERGLKVNVHTDRVEHLSLWVRGSGAGSERSRTLRAPIRGEERAVPVFRRLAVVARLHAEPHVRIRLFRDIPHHDVEALLPHAEVRMSLLDRAKMIGSGASAFGFIAKLYKLMIGIALWAKLLWVIPIGLAIFGVRTLLGYRSARTMRTGMRTQHLYYRSIASNSAALHTLVTMIKQEELKEALLSYVIGNGRCPGAHELRRTASDYLRERFGADVVFDAADGIATLDRLGAVNEDGTLVDADRLDETLRTRAPDAVPPWFHLQPSQP